MYEETGNKGVLAIQSGKENPLRPGPVKTLARVEIQSQEDQLPSQEWEGFSSA